MSGPRQVDLLLKTYRDALTQRGNARYVTFFRMFDRSNVLLYWLFFCSNHLRGLEEMKQAMWHVDKEGRFRFSESDNPNQLRLLADVYDQHWLAGQLESELVGKTMTAAEVKEWVLVETPCCLFKGALKLLELDLPRSLRVVEAPLGRRKGTFGDDSLKDIKIRFERGLF